MQKIADVTAEKDVIRVSGDLDFDNVMRLCQKAKDLFSKYDELVFDFSSVTSSSSAGLAMIVDWIKEAHLQQKPIRFINLSKDIHSIARASGLEALIEKM